MSRDAHQTIIQMVKKEGVDNRCMYMAHVCFYVCCSDCVGSVGMFVV